MILDHGSPDWDCIVEQPHFSFANEIATREFLSLGIRAQNLKKMNLTPLIHSQTLPPEFLLELYFHSVFQLKHSLA